MSTEPARTSSVWLPGLVAAILRDRHPVLQGNTDDLVRMDDEWLELPDALSRVLRAMDMSLIAHLDLARGLVFPEPDHAATFLRLLRRTAAPAPPAVAGRGSTPSAGANDALGALDAQEGVVEDEALLSVDRALPALRAVFSRPCPPMGVVVDAPELMVQDPERSSESARRALAQLRAVAGLSRGHALVFVLRNEVSIPSWLMSTVPLLERIVVPMPDRVERLHRSAAGPRPLLQRGHTVRGARADRMGTTCRSIGWYDGP